MGDERAGRDERSWIADLRVTARFFPAWVVLVGVGGFFLATHTLSGALEEVIRWVPFAVAGLSGAYIEQRLLKTNR